LAKKKVKTEIKPIVAKPSSGIDLKVPKFWENIYIVAVVTLIIGLLLGAAGMLVVAQQPITPTGDSDGPGLSGVVSAADVATKTEAFLVANLLGDGFTASNAVANSFSDNLYEVELTVTSGGQAQQVSVFVTKDAKTLFIASENVSMFDLDNPPQIPDGSDTPTPPPAGPVEVSADDDPFLGPEDAAIVVIEFSDFQCSYCGASAGTYEPLISQFKARDPTWEAAVPKLKELAEQGKIKFVYRDFPLSNHPFAQKAAEASECAEEQGKFWEYHDMLFENYSALDVDSLKQYAVDLELDADAFNECLDSGQMADEVAKDFADGSAYGVSGTPAFFVNGVLVSGAQSFSVFEQIFAGLEE
tara:strand:+ start:225 stop:1298 length:1074 start_codon:yes stop_codon:yes gene_type:complete